jgi:hypothetical protein
MTLFTEQSDPTIKTIDPNKDYLAEYVGEDKPFKSTLELARGKAESDAFIENLKNENKALRTQVTTAMTMQEFLDKMEKTPANKGDPVVNNQNANADQPKENEPNNNNKTISEEDIVRVLETREALKVRNSNLETVENTLKKVWGANYQNILEEKVSEMGVSKKFLDDMAMTQPKAFLKLMDVETAFNQKQEELSIFAPAPKGVNTQGQNQQSSTGPKTMKEFKKAFPNERDFYTPRVQNAMTRAIKEFGEEKFYA